MTMKLLTPTEAQKRSRSDDVLNAVRSKELSDAVSDKQVELARLEEAGAKFLASQRARWAIEDQEHLLYKTDLLKEVEVLEERKKKALIPIEEIRVEADNKLQEADSVLMRALEKEEHAEDMASVLEKRFDEVSERELEVKTQLSKLNRRESGIKQQEKHTARYAEGVSQAAQLFLDRSMIKEAELDKRANDLQVAQFELDVRQIAQGKREKELDEREGNLKSRYEALAAAEKEIKQKYVLNNSISSKRRQ